MTLIAVPRYGEWAILSCRHAKDIGLWLPMGVMPGWELWCDECFWRDPRCLDAYRRVLFTGGTP